MRFVPIKSAEQQGVMVLHRMREGFKEERTACINRIRGGLAEFDRVFGKSPKVLSAVLSDVIEDASNELTGLARMAVQQAYEHWRALDERMRGCDQQIGAHVRSSPAAQRAAKINGVGEIGASALTAAWAISGSSRMASSSVHGGQPTLQKACVAMTYKNAHVLWAVMTREQAFYAHHISVEPQAKCSPVKSARLAEMGQSAACTA